MNIFVVSGSRSRSHRVTIHLIFKTLFPLCNSYLWERPYFLDFERTPPHVHYWIKWNCDKLVFETDGVKRPWTTKQLLHRAIGGLCKLFFQVGLFQLHFRLILEFFSSFSGFPRSTKTNTPNSNSTKTEDPHENQLRVLWLPLWINIL